MSSPSWGLKDVGNREISREIRFESPSDTCAHRHGKHSAGVAEAQDQLGIAIEFKPLDEAGTNFMQVERLGEDRCHQLTGYRAEPDPLHRGTREEMVPAGVIGG